MIELNAGMHRELTGRENIRLLGAFMGLSPRVMNTRMDEIVAFSELEDWLDEPVRKYSSGMLARLGFSVAMNVNADILLVDEVLAVGDTAFRRKCYDRMESLRADGITILFVSHTMRQIERLCGNALVLDHGRIAFQGTAGDAVHYYMDRLDAAQLATIRAQGQRGVPYTGTGEAVFTAVELLDHNQLPADTLPAGAPIRLRLRYHAKRRIPQPILGVGIIAPEMVQLALQTNENDPQRPDLEGEGEILCTFPALRLTPGGYTIKAGILGADGRPIYKANTLCPFRIAAQHPAARFESGGLVETEVHWEYPTAAEQKA
jgi:energy-coupling factor transporter ATP-binding protein EcfA2